MSRGTFGRRLRFPATTVSEALAKLEDNLLLFFTGYTRSASQILADQDRRTRSMDQEMIDNLHFAKELGYQSKSAPRTIFATLGSTALGQLACPPEDCRGIPGFYDLLDALRDPTHEEHQELRDWVGGDYGAEVFSIEAVNRILTRLIPHRSRRSSRGAGTVAR